MQPLRRTFGIYLLFQLPGWGVAACLLTLAWQLGWLSAGWCGAIGGLVVAKDLLLFPAMRRAFEPTRLHGPEALVGRLAVVERDLDPEGAVRIGAERWRARSVGSEPMRAGARVEVLEVEGLTLRVDGHRGAR